MKFDVYIKETNQCNTTNALRKVFTLTFDNVSDRELVFRQLVAVCTNKLMSI